MTPEKFKSIRSSLALTQRQLAHWITPQAKNNDRLIRAWESGERTVPHYIDTMMKMFEDGCVPRHINRGEDDE